MVRTSLSIYNASAEKAIVGLAAQGMLFLKHTQVCKVPTNQGCQIFLGATYQNGKKITKRP
jgi:hypothetical protein